MLRHARRVVIVGLLAALLLAMVPAHVSAAGPIGPRAMLYAYYDLINARNYWPAYQQWINPSQTYADFVSGYGDTSFVRAYFGGFQAGWARSTEGRVPGILIGYRTNGTVVAFSGCYDVRYNPGGSGMAQWLITDGNFTEMAAVPVSEAVIWQQTLDMWCYSPPAVPGSYASVQQMLVDYFEAVNRGDYADAYALWANPVQTYADFVNGWLDTTETVMFYGAYQFGGVFGSAETGRVPVVLLGYHVDGSLVAFQGCLGVNYNTALARRWSLWAAYLQPLPFTLTPDTYAISLALNTPCY